MNRKYSLIKPAVVQYLCSNRDESGDLPHGLIRQTGKTYGVPSSTVADWWSEAQVLEDSGLDPVSPKFHASSPYSIDGHDKAEDILNVINRSRNLYNAWETCTTLSLYKKGYVQFCRDRESLPKMVLAFATSGIEAAHACMPIVRQKYPYPTFQYVFDHTVLDVEVIPDSGNGRPFRPTASLVVDAFSGTMLAFALSREGITTEHTLALLAEAFIIREDTTSDGQRVSIGGIPNIIVFDNAAAHHSNDVQNLLTRLGISMAPIPAYSHWMQGTAENRNGLLAQLAKGLPGATHAGQSTNAKPLRQIRDHHGRLESKSLLTMEACFLYLNEEITRYNRERSNERWLNISVEQRDVPAEEVRLMALREDRPRILQPSGIHFRNQYYTSGDIEKFTIGSDLSVRYLPRQKDWIVVSDGKNTSTFYASDKLPAKDLMEISRSRKEQNKKIRGLERNLQSFDAHVSLLANEWAQIPEADRPSMSDVVHGIVTESPSTRSRTEGGNEAETNHSHNDLDKAEWEPANLDHAGIFNGKRKLPRVTIADPKASAGQRSKSRTRKSPANTADIFDVLKTASEFIEPKGDKL